MKHVTEFLTPLVNKTEEFKTLYGDELYTKLISLKTILNEYISTNSPCTIANCKLASKPETYRCCYHCDKTCGCFRVKPFYDIVTKEDLQTIVKSYRTSFGFHETAKNGCRLPIASRSYVCNTYFCNNKLLSEKMITMIGLYSYLIIMYKGFVDDKIATKQAVGQAFSIINNSFDNLKDKPEDSKNLSWVRKYTKIIQDIGSEKFTS